MRCVCDPQRVAGTAQPAYGLPGGGGKVIFTAGSPDHTVTLPQDHSPRSQSCGLGNALARSKLCFVVRGRSRWDRRHSGNWGRHSPNHEGTASSTQGQHAQSLNLGTRGEN